MEDITVGIICLAVIMMFMATVVSISRDTDNYSVKPLSEQRDTIFNKHRRIF